MSDSFQETAIKEVGDKLDISGLQDARTWETKDKRSGNIICGVVKKWSFASARAARNMAAGRSPARAESTPSGASGAGGERNNKYKIESQESLDF
jgi:hypothetical protein